MSRTQFALRALGGALVVAVLAAAPAQAQMPAVQSFTGGSEFTSFHGGTGDVIGFRFTVNSAVMVDQLGAWNADNNESLGLEVNPSSTPIGGGSEDLDSDHMVGIWDDTQTLLASVSVTTTSTILGDYRYEAITPIMLSPGTTYTAGMLYSDTDNDNYVSSNTTLVTDPEVNHVVAVFPLAGDLGFVFPTEESAGNLGRHGPNFTLMVIPAELTEFSVDGE